MNLYKVKIVREEFMTVDVMSNDGYGAVEQLKKELKEFPFRVLGVTLLKEGENT